MRNTILMSLFLLFAAGAAHAADLDSTEWRVVFETRSLGPIESVMTFRARGGSWEARTRSLSPIAIDLVSGADGTLAGPVVSGKPGPKATLRHDGDRIEGAIDGGLLQGAFHGSPFAGTLPLRDYAAVLASLDDVAKRRVYRPADLATPGWTAFRKAATAVAAAARDDFDFLMGIRKAWKNEPFSHFRLLRSAASSDEMAAGFDAMRTGRQSARLSFDGDVAVLAVDTMMGGDTIEQIDAAYAEIALRKPRALVIDLRENEGGAFAVVPLVQHLLREPLEAGTFLGNRWWGAQNRVPTEEERLAASPWTGWSIVSFWRDAQAQGLLRIRFEPQAPGFDGKVWILTSGRTASAAELAADALRSANRAQLVGEKTKGEMLSGSYFDLRDGFVLYLPVADYLSRRVGRIDGKGLEPDVAIPADQALAEALALARR